MLQEIIFLPEKIIFNQRRRRIFHATINKVPPAEIISCHKKYILVTGNQFLPQEINSSQKNLLSLVKLVLSTCGIAWILRKILPEPGSPVPWDYAALVESLS